MRSTIHTIKSKIYEQHSNIDPAHIDEILDLYFEHVKDLTFDLKKPEISLLWGTLVVRPRYVRSRIERLERAIENFKQDGDRTKLIGSSGFLLVRGKRDQIIKHLSSYTEDELITLINQYIEHLKNLVNLRLNKKLIRTGKNVKK